MRHLNFYAELGKLLHMLEKNDDLIPKGECQQLKDIVKQGLTPADRPLGQWGLASAKPVKREPDFDDEEASDALDAFDSFVSYADVHQSALNDQQKEIIQYLARHLVGQYRSRHEKEQEMLTRLRLKLDRIALQKQDD